MCQSPIQNQFEDAITDLWWMSETDAPFQCSLWPDAFADGFSIPELLQITEHRPDTSCEEVTLDRFFQPALRTQEWHGEDEKEDIRRCQALKTLIVTRLTDIHVVRMGEVNIDIYILGKTQQNQWIALSTQAVET